MMKDIDCLTLSTTGSLLSRMIILKTHVVKMVFM